MDKIQDLLNRSDLFRLLSACFYEPDRAMFLEENVCLNLESLLASISPAAATGARHMHVALTDSSQEELVLDYARLFVGPFELLAAPYGSVYLEKNRRLMGDSTIIVQRYYVAEELQVDVKQPPDHIAVELEFMSFLGAKEVAAMKRQDSVEATRLHGVQRDFFTFALGWIPDFCEQIRGGAETSYYRSLGDCLANFYTGCKQIYT